MGVESDRELLELAARAALGRTSIPNHAAQLLIKGWDPLNDDGDAQRLMVKLYMRVERLASCAVVSVDHLNFKGEITERFTVEDAGEHIGTRRAIVRAAAEIGRAMP